MKDKVRTTYRDEQGKKKNTRLFQVWWDIKKRCFNPRHSGYCWYGGRGITVCEEWKTDFQAFARWALVSGYTKCLQIDRRDNNGNYTPENCRFVTSRENGSNRRTNNDTIGVSWHKRHLKWISHIMFERKLRHLGYYTDKNIAAFAYELALASIQEVESE